MSITPRIILNNLSFHLENTPVLFTQVNLCFEGLKYGIVGHNGVGKTTLLKLLTGERAPTSGSIQSVGTVAQVPQSHSAFAKEATIADVLGVSKILQAYTRIRQGSVDSADFDLLSGLWDIEQRLEEGLVEFNLWPIDLNKLFAQLSGGEKTKILLAKTLIFPGDILMFDEPTNNLDTASREILYRYIQTSPKAMLIVSHDRTLLNMLDKILEVSTLGCEMYGGNYDFYVQQKEIKRLAMTQEVLAREKILKKSQQTTQSRVERYEQSAAKGRKAKQAQIKAKGRYDKIDVKSKIGQSQKTNRRIRLQAQDKLARESDALAIAREKLEVLEPIVVSLPETHVPNNKVVLKIENLSFAYQQGKNLFDNVNLQVIGSERVAITGTNGSGKSTLIKLIRGILQPSAGKIMMGVNNIVYLDQTVSFLDSTTSLVENFLRLNPDSLPEDAYAALASFKFRNKNAEKRVACLSGGERMRAGLAITLMAKQPPQLIILDEPTNHLDLKAIQALEEALQVYQGAILVVSHDHVFLQRMQVSRWLRL